MGNRVVAGSHEYLLFQGGLSDAADGDWYLRSEGQEVPIPILRPEVGSFLGNRYFAERMFVHTLHQRQADPDPTLDSAEEGRGPVWANISGVNNDSHSTDGLVALHGQSWRLQTGMDLLRKRSEGGSLLRAGGFLQYGQANTDARAVLNPASAKGEVDGYSVGAYATWLGDPQRMLGAYVDAWAQYGRFDNSVTGSGGFKADYDAKGWAASVEFGYGLQLWKRVVLEPQIQYVRINLDTDRLIDTSRTRIRDTSRSDWVARVGARLYGVPEKPAGLSPFIEVNWWRRAGNASMLFNDDRMEQFVPKSLTTVEVGVQGVSSNGWQAWMRLGSDVSDEPFREINASLGLRYQW